jgi:hypothetical protein
MDTSNLVVSQTQDLPGTLEIQLKAERVQEPQSLQAEPFTGCLYGLSIRPAQPVSIALSGSSVVFTLHGPGGTASGGPAEAA